MKFRAVTPPAILPVPVRYILIHNRQINMLQSMVRTGRPQFVQSRPRPLQFANFHQRDQYGGRKVPDRLHIPDQSGMGGRSENGRIYPSGAPANADMAAIAGGDGADLEGWRGQFRLTGVQAILRPGLVCAKGGVMAKQGAAIGAANACVPAHVEIDMRVIMRRRGPHAFKFRYANNDLIDSGIINKSCPAMRRHYPCSLSESLPVGSLTYYSQ